MKVKELINKLQQQDPESDVLINYSEQVDSCDEMWSENKNICFIGNQKHKLKVKDYVKWLENHVKWLENYKPRDEFERRKINRRLLKLYDELRDNPNMENMKLVSEHTYFIGVFFNENGEEIFE